MLSVPRPSRTVKRKDDEVSEADWKEKDEHPELERAYDSERGGQVADGQAEDRGYRTPDPGRDDAVQGGENHSPERGERRAAR